METKMLYRPLTATPFKHNSAYQEIEPCRMLQSYVRCFWGGRMTSGTEAVESSGIVIPDTCVDIIYRMDDMGNIIISDFVGINDRSFFIQSNNNAENKMEVLRSVSMRGAHTLFARTHLPERLMGDMMSGKDSAGWTGNCAAVCPSRGIWQIGFD